MDLRKIKKLIELVEESGLSELEVKSGEEAVRIVRTMPFSDAACISEPAPTSVQQDLAATGSTTHAREIHPPGFVVEAPLTGTFYRAPAPGEKPFVNSGQQVNTGDVLCIIESMKMMNPIEAERAGKVTTVLVEDGQPVEMGRSLFIID